MKPDIDKSLFDGLFKRNTLFVSGLVIAPVVAFANTTTRALLLAFSFSSITFLTLMISVLISRKIVYTFRIILYTAIAAVVYVPVYATAGDIFPNEIGTMGIYLPLLITNSLIVLQSELIFFRKPKDKMIFSVIFYILGFDAAVVVYGALREIISFGTIFGRMVLLDAPAPGFAQTFGGFMLLGLCAAGYRKLLSLSGRRVTVAEDEKGE